MNYSSPNPPAECYASVPSAAAADEALLDLASLRVSIIRNQRRSLAQPRAAPHRAARGLHARGRRLDCAHWTSAVDRGQDAGALTRIHSAILRQKNDTHDQEKNNLSANPILYNSITPGRLIF